MNPVLILGVAGFVIPLVFGAASSLVLFIGPVFVVLAIAEVYQRMRNFSLAIVAYVTFTITTMAFTGWMFGLSWLSLVMFGAAVSMVFWGRYFWLSTCRKHVTG